MSFQRINVLDKLAFKLIAADASCRSNHRLKPRLFFGPVQIINNKYFSQAMAEDGFIAKTIVYEHFDINSHSDFDMYFYEIAAVLKKNPLKRLLFRRFSKHLLLHYLVKNFDIFHISYKGLIFESLALRHYEVELLKKLGKKVIVMPYGGDSYIYSKILDPSLRHVLTISYPKHGMEEKEIQGRVWFWAEHADFRIGGIYVDGFPVWDVLTVNYLALDTRKFLPRKYGHNDGKNGKVKIIHTPNHRGFKGTEFIIDAVNKLKHEGLNVELLLFEKVPNSHILKVMQEEADILVEQLIAPGYAMSGLEGMASGIPVISNLSDERYTQVLRRYSFLDECPVVSASPESIYSTLKYLVTHPECRRELGAAGRSFTEKYHSYTSTRYFFNTVYDKIWYGNQVEFWKLYHPLISESYNNKSPKIKHPLVNNRLPEELLSHSNK